MDNLVIGVMGNRNSGKSHTWNTLFGRRVKTGDRIRRLYVTDAEYVEVFLVSGSAEERQLPVGEIIGNLAPQIVLCSMQYRPGVDATMQYFLHDGYLPYVHWLNPGFNDVAVAVSDALGIVPLIQAAGGSVELRDGKADATARVEEMRQYICQWAAERLLLRMGLGSRIIVSV